MRAPGSRPCRCGARGCQRGAPLAGGRWLPGGTGRPWSRPARPGGCCRWLRRFPLRNGAVLKLVLEVGRSVPVTLEQVFPAPSFISVSFLFFFQEWGFRLMWLRSRCTPGKAGASAGLGCELGTEVNAEESAAVTRGWESSSLGSEPALPRPVAEGLLVLRRLLLVLHFSM